MVNGTEMSYMQRVSNLSKAALAVMVGALLPGFMTPAYADTSTAMANAPTCMHVDLDDSGWTDYLTVTNACGSYQRAKVILANAPDLSCTGYSSGQSRTWRWGAPGRFDGLAGC